MKPLLLHFWRLCLLGAEPHETPCSLGLLRLLVVGYLLSGLPGLAMQYPLPASLAQMAIDALLLGVVTAATLAARRRLARFVQSYSALLGVGTVFNLLALPPLIGLHAGAQTGAPAGLSLLLTGLFIWYILAAAHIFHKSLDLPFPAGVLATLLYILPTLYLVGTLFPSEPLS